MTSEDKGVHVKFDASALRRDTDEDKFPYDNRAVTFIHVDSSGVVTADHTKTGKITILYDWRPGELLIATWTGSRRSDTFSVDVDAARKALLVNPVPRVAAKVQERRRGLGPRQNQLVKQLREELDSNGRHRYTVQQLADEFGTSCYTIREAIKAASPVVISPLPPERVTVSWPRPALGGATPALPTPPREG